MAFTAEPVRGQVPDQLEGERLRITSVCGERGAGEDLETCTLTGRLESLSGDSVAIATDAGPIRLARRDVERVDVSLGTRSFARTGGVLGGVLGAGATYAALNTGGSTALCDQDANQDSVETRYCAGLYLAGGVAGFVLGRWLGGGVVRERWEAIPLDRLRVGLWLPSTRGRMGLRLAIRR